MIKDAWVGQDDLRHKLVHKHLPRRTWSDGVDLREKLSRTVHVHQELMHDNACLNLIRDNTWMTVKIPVSVQQSWISYFMYFLKSDDKKSGASGDDGFELVSRSPPSCAGLLLMQMGNCLQIWGQTFKFSIINGCCMH
ncbi:uncharacterized protein LOC131221473 [Magnolia sinica]|uniref:uncharacterized protein LOC131221473 n=1 Tax=Magnolia sinica TaxID=86752 RepID=UPI00265849FA|nr:uncharacterized protein LOC131221473 [Magnolia sinica]